MSYANENSDAARTIQVTNLLGDYFDALYESDETKMAAIFHDGGIYATADESPPLLRDKGTYMDVLSRRQSPQSRGEGRHDIIDSIEFAGSNTARAKVRCSIGNSNFVDYLTLIHDQGRWQIIAKVFQIDAQEAS